MRISRFMKVCRQHAKRDEVVFTVKVADTVVGKSTSIHAIKELTRNLDSFTICIDEGQFKFEHGNLDTNPNPNPNPNPFVKSVVNHLQMSALPKETEQGITQLLRICKEINEDIVFKVYDTESYVGRGRGIDSVLDLLEGGDEQVSIHCCILADNGELVEDLGWFGVLPYEDCDWLYNWANNEFCARVEKVLDMMGAI